jgi:hypothetical protein
LFVVFGEGFCLLCVESAYVDSRRFVFAPLFLGEVVFLCWGLICICWR